MQEGVGERLPGREITAFQRPQRQRERLEPGQVSDGADQDDAERNRRGRKR